MSRGLVSAIWHRHILEDAQYWAQLEFWICQAVEMSGGRDSGTRAGSEDDDV